ncbi:TPA: DUF4365 domain-containing protein [Citrobacter freundii]|uniref:DUF4365 domain-containing protein n=1 Tax=Citrobacter freundii TaxID=546 RepID=UPI001576101D|nr:DUF4365 domain-containing protein [Citrobacter freundii]NTX97417.1 DUF4365 domain-containing protein [Citrobacter freundii]HAT7540679.1 DUF4365 domain-containing protein [Citrobacter freundii]HAU4326525.1 DUF4365 domain-containing protein [Citrobacter freundii]
MTSESNRTGALGVNYVERVLLEWGWGFQKIDQENDDGFDGIIYIRSKKVDPDKPNDKRRQYWEGTGGLIHVQIKTGDGYLKKRDVQEIRLGLQKVDEKRLLCKRSALPCILIFVSKDEKGKEYSYWTDLKSDSTYDNKSVNIVKVPLKNRFFISPECKGPLRKLARSSHGYIDKPIIDLTKYDSLHGLIEPKLPGGLNLSLKHRAINFYKDWKRIGAINPYFGEVLINRTGWSHITRKDRPMGRIETSFSLLPYASRIINDVTTWRMLTSLRKYENRQDKHVTHVDFIGLTAKVIIKNRGATEVMVVLKRETKFLHGDLNSKPINRVWFYTVYEPGRGK